MSKRLVGLLAAIACLGVLAVPATASAASITFTFDYYTLPPHVDPHTPIYGGALGTFGTLTISDPNVGDVNYDPNRVNISFQAILPAAYAGATIEQFYINFVSPFQTNTDFFLVSQTALPGTNNDSTPYQGETLGAVGYANGLFTYDLANFVFDVRPDATSGALTLNAALALYKGNVEPNANDPINLDASMFNLTSGGTNSPAMYAGYRTNVFNVNQSLYPNFPDGEFFAFASTTAVPEPATLFLLGSGLVGLATWRRRAGKR